jgi:hypothetical protein
MSSLSRDPKRVLAILIAGVVGVLVLIDFAGPTPVVSQLAALLVNWAATLTAIALLIGLVSVAVSHVRRVMQRSSDWLYSVILLVAMLTVIIVGVSQGSPAEGPVRTLFRTVYEPLASSLLALLAFFSLSAALRALQRRSLEATVIVAIAAVVLLLQLPPISALPYVGATLAWVNDYLALAGARGLLIGSALGALVAGVRVLLGFDTPYLDR